MSNQFLREFSLGLDSEISSLGKLALGSDASAFPTTAMQPQAMQPQPSGYPTTSGAGPILSPRADAMWPSVRAGIFAGESGGDYNALFNYQNRQGGQFSNINLTDMTVDQAIAFSDPNGPYANYVRGQVGRTATPMGAYQIVGKTLRGLKKDLGLKGDERMTPELQDKLGQHLWKQYGTGQWEGYKGPGDPKAVMSTRNVPTDRDVDVSELEKNAPDLSPEAQARRRQGMLLMAIGQGLGQLSRGETVDLSNVLSDYQAHQAEMQDRLQEIAMERRRQEERYESRDWQEQDIATYEDQQIASENRAERRDIASENRDIAREEAKAKGMSTALAAMYPNSPWLSTAQEVTRIDPTVGFNFAKTKYDEENQAVKTAQEQAANDSIAQIYESQGLDDLATMARNGDLVGARDMYKELNGVTDAQLDAKILERGGPEAAALAYRLNLESGADTNPQYTAAAGLEQKYLEEQGKLIINNREKQGQLEAMSALLSDSDLDTGMFQAAIQPFNELLRSFGLGDTAKTDQKTVIQAIGKHLVSFMRKPGEGVVSNADATRFEAASPSLGKSPEANRLLTYVHLETIKRAETAYNARMEYFAKGGRVDDTDARDAYIKQKVDATHGASMFESVGTAENGANVEIGKPYMIGESMFMNLPNSTVRLN